MAITKDMTIGQLVMNHPKTPAILMNFGMMCVGCPSAQGETIEEAAMVHGMDIEKLLEELNKNA
ncbi:MULTISPECIES: DUF1858 domain-containing protein [Clostridium]|uniref:DUF1858 domain-containing protein n=1 Tax=Clostridium brassicae TaxID=2999072 RepID=A0ABT4D7M4_9CLOT|nr:MULTISPECIES: DUF1858 domain-containing protein [Clostridium]MCY6958163.1 DUF1858 domain-containing protein [Clostridium brassicae]WMJ80116.1 DUF1858 domain-containing protein [Clostridium sp. MB40-C1]